MLDLIELSAKQEAIYNFIKRELTVKGYPPSVREICDAVGLKSTSTVHGHLEKLEQKGYIRRDPTKPRAIEIIDYEYDSVKKNIVNIPIVGNVSAGIPILAQENIENVFPLSRDYIGETDCFILRVKGDSMVNAGILDSDYVVVRKQNYAKNGDKVVALVNNEESTVKTFYKENDHFRLQPENDYYEPIILSEVEILGIVIGLYRNYLY